MIYSKTMTEMHSMTIGSEFSFLISVFFILEFGGRKIVIHLKKRFLDSHY